jgi:hypothetical protein
MGRIKSATIVGDSLRESPALAERVRHNGQRYLLYGSGNEAEVARNAAE